jgi:hypothetical protein
MLGGCLPDPVWSLGVPLAGNITTHRHVLDAICYMRINLRESARSVRERLRDTESARGSCERAARVRETCEKNFARNLQGLRSWFKLQEI